MKIRTSILIYILSLGIYTKAQNIVINPSFEQHTQCPTSYSQINYCNSWHNGSNQSSCDYYSANGCSGNFSPPAIVFNSSLNFYQQPLSGESFVGILPYFSNSNLREFLQGKLNSSLNAGGLYYVEFYVNATSQQEYFIHDISALITDTAILVNQNNLQNYSPQILPTPNLIYKDTLKWMRVNGYYTALGSENYITIGNYSPYGHEIKDSVSSPYQYASYFVDSVGVYPVTHLDAWNAGPDRYINIGDSTQIGNPNTDYSIFSWVTSTNSATYLTDSTDAHTWSKPLQTTTYYVTKTQNTNVFEDTVTVYVTNNASISEFETNKEVKVYPNPTNDKIYIESKSVIEIKLFNLLGNEITATKQKEIDVSKISDGVYLYTVINEQGLVKTGKIIILK